MGSRGRASATLVGRGSELDRLAGWLTAGTTALVRGEPGVGKSALLRAALAERGDDVVTVGIRALRAVPYAPIRAAVPHLAPTARPREVARLLAAEVRAGGGVLVVDDVQWCDRDTIEVLGELALQQPIVVAARTDAGDADELVALLADVGEVIDLEPLDDAGAAALVRRLRPGAPRSEVTAIVDRAVGNPLDLSLYATADEQDATSTAAAEMAVSGLGTADLEAVATLALSGRPAVLPARQAARLRAAGAITVDPSGRARPRHDRVVDAVLDRLGADRVRRVHAALAATASDVSARAVHLAAAGERADAATAACAAAEAAPTSVSRAGFLSLAATNTDPPDPALTLDAADALSLAGRYRECIELLDRLGGVEAPSAAVALARARAQWAITDIDDARIAISHGLAADDLTPGVHAELLALRSRILGRVDWDLDGAVAAASEAVVLAGDDGRRQAAARSALGLAYLMSGDARWQDELEVATRLAVEDEDLHNASTLGDALFFGHLLSGDPSRCAPLAGELIEATSQGSTAWHRYFRAIALLARVQVDGDHRTVLVESEHLLRQRLTVRAREAARTARTFALLDGGRDLDALELAEESWRLASDDAARSMAGWLVAEASWIAGRPERSLEVAEATRALPVPGFPAAVFCALDERVGVIVARPRTGARGGRGGAVGLPEPRGGRRRGRGTGHAGPDCGQRGCSSGPLTSGAAPAPAPASAPAGPRPTAPSTPVPSIGRLRSSTWWSRRTNRSASSGSAAESTRRRAASAGAAAGRPAVRPGPVVSR